MNSLKKKIVFLGISSSFLLLIFIPELFQTKKINPKKINTILSLSPAHTKTLEYLGLGDHIIGISIYDQDPNYQHLSKIGGGVNFNQEAILRLNPDLITIGDIKNTESSLKFIRSQGIQTLILPTKSFKDIYQSLFDLQKLFPNKNLTNKIIQFKTEWDIIKNSPIMKRKKVLVIIGLDPIYTIAQDNYMNELITYIGWNNSITSVNPYPILSQEDLIKISPIDSIIIPTQFNKELKSISNIFNRVKATEIIFISNNNFNLPSPYLINVIKELRN